MAAMPALAIPTLDISAFVAWQATAAVDAAPPPAVQAVVDAWRDAYATYGFSQVVGHGVPDTVIEDAHELGKAFFERTTEGERAVFADAAVNDRGRGYKAKGVVNVAGAGVNADGSAAVARPPDYAMELIALGDGRDPDVSSLVPGLNAAVDAYFAAMLGVNRVFMQLTALALGMPRAFFDGGFAGHSWLNRLRLAYYPSQKRAAAASGQLRYGEHTDWQAFTLLWQDHNEAGRPQCADAPMTPPPGGLQVEIAGDSSDAARAGTKPGTTFVDCTPAPRALTVNAGDQIEVWTNGTFKSCIHRVANPPPGSDSARLSLVLFTGPQPDTALAPLPTCVSPENPAKFPATTSGEHLLAKIAASEA